MTVRATVGDATVELSGEEQTVSSDEGHVRTSMHYRFDDVLHAASRVGAGVLGSEDARFVIARLSDLRVRLAERAEARRRTTKPEENDRHGR